MSGTKTIVPNMPKPVRKPTIIETLKVEFLKSEKGTIGWSLRISIKKKTARMTAATASRLSTSGEVQPWSRVIESATIRGTRPATNAAAPGKSMSRIDADERTYGIVTRTRRTAIRPTGRLTKKTQRQPQLSAIYPPAVGPTIDETPKTAR